MSDERFDFSALDLNKDTARAERMVGNIMWRARAELARRAAARELGAVELVAGWYRPALAAAAAIAAVSLTLLATVRPTPAAQTTAFVSASDVPAAMSVWYEEERSPTAAELLVVANEGGN
jgi:hypothetical protein